MRLCTERGRAGGNPGDASDTTAGEACCGTCGGAGGHAGGDSVAAESGARRSADRALRAARGARRVHGVAADARETLFFPGEMHFRHAPATAGTAHTLAREGVHAAQSPEIFRRDYCIGGPQVLLFARVAGYGRS